MYGENFGRPHVACLQLDWSVFLNDFGIWRASWWYMISSYKMYTTKVIQGVNMNRLYGYVTPYFI